MADEIIGNGPDGLAIMLSTSNQLNVDPKPKPNPERIALWKVQYSGAKSARAYESSGKRTVIAKTLEEVVLKFRMSDKAFENCRITSVYKCEDVDIGIPGVGDD